ncbi:hypothetical protein JR316_0003883 [Psilocybe cubensis]|uniref:Uncharacterized protein n=2 Tax=Psilocybe cubensis TaxID=181762 RepID=A0A8H8CNI0_PSICU|nr:hypothetical protein JR316_0003883 [Psilocybe cubensis]KAH9484402.1 hypothetical protein JR316_0003883 [Psilocybe cubensis]
MHLSSPGTSSIEELAYSDIVDSSVNGEEEPSVTRRRAPVSAYTFDTLPNAKSAKDVSLTPSQKSTYSYPTTCAQRLDSPIYSLASPLHASIESTREETPFVSKLLLAKPSAGIARNTKDIRYYPFKMLCRKKIFCKYKTPFLVSVHRKLQSVRAFCKTKKSTAEVLKAARRLGRDITVLATLQEQMLQEYGLLLKMTTAFS